jgi:hypothetical protein
MKNIIVAFVALSTISAFAECRIVQTGHTASKLTVFGRVFYETTQTHLIKNNKELFTAEMTVRIKANAKIASKAEIERALGVWISQKEKLEELAVEARCGEEILGEISEASFSVGY